MLFFKSRLIYAAALFFSLPLCAESEIEVAMEQMASDVKACRLKLASLAANNPEVLTAFDTLIMHLENHALKKRGEFDFRPFLRALSFAAEKHAGQVWDDRKVPYIVHPLGVCLILWEEGRVRHLNVLIAAILHDTLEETKATAAEIEKKFGMRVSQTVAELTDDPQLSPEQNKHRQLQSAPTWSWNAQCIALADRLYIVRDLHESTNWNKEEVVSYFEGGRKLLGALRGTNEVLELALHKELLKNAHEAAPRTKS